MQRKLLGVTFLVLGIFALLIGIIFTQMMVQASTTPSDGSPGGITVIIAILIVIIGFIGLLVTILRKYYR